MKSVNYYIRMYDAKHRIPRPRNSPHLPAHLAAVDFLGTLGSVALLFLLSFVAAFFVIYGVWNFGIAAPTSYYIYCLAALFAISGPLESGKLWIPYYRVSERSTHGTSQWATYEDLRDRGLAREGTEGREQGDLYICKLQSGEDVLLPLDQVMSGVAIVGPQGSGKSDTILYNMILNWSKTGSAVILDPKGELYAKTAMEFQTAYRFDLDDATKSDRWDFVRTCRGNAQYAFQCASIILGVGGNGNKQGGNNEKFWERSETAALTAILLHLAEIYKGFASASEIPKFISDNNIEDRKDPETQEITRGMDYIMRNSPSLEAQRFWGIFSKAKDELIGNIITGIAVVCQAFMVDVVAHAMAPLSEAEREQSVGQTAFFNVGLTGERAPREINLEHLRTPGTAVYIVVQEGEAATYAVVLSTLLGLANSVLRKTKVVGNDKPVTPVLFVCEEAGNLPIHGLQEMLGVGRGRRIGPVLVYQDIPAVYTQYGQEQGGSILDKLGTKIFLAGLGVASAEYAAKCLGDTTVQRHSSVDARGSKMDQERTTDVQRKLMDASEIRQLTKFVNCLMITADAPPIKGVFPPRCPLTPAEYCKAPTLSKKGGVSIDDATMMNLLTDVRERLVSPPLTTRPVDVQVQGQTIPARSLAPNRQAAPPAQPAASALAVAGAGREDEEPDEADDGESVAQPAGVTTARAAGSRVQVEPDVFSGAVRPSQDEGQSRGTGRYSRESRATPVRAVQTRTPRRQPDELQGSFVLSGGELVTEGGADVDAVAEEIVANNVGAHLDSAVNGGAADLPL